jgi:arylsulfatase A-like enzyme
MPLKFSYTLIFVAVFFFLHSYAEKPNIVWIVVDDMSCHFGYQGESLVTTPNVDRLARDGIVFTNAYATAPVCSTFRSAMITSMYQTTIGAHHHRSSRGVERIHLPEGIKTVPEYFRQAGYYTSISSAKIGRNGKQDYNFEYDQKVLYHGSDWRKRAKGQPFFAQYQLRGGKLRNIDKTYYNEVKPELPKLVPADKVKLPPYYPDHSVIREDWAKYLDSVNYTDLEVGRILETLKEENVLENTIVFFLTDHGISHARGKQFLYEEGVKIPFVVWSAKGIESKKVRDELIAHIDLGATSLDLAGIDIPAHIQGRTLFGPNVKKREFVVSARDRCDETVDRIRSIRFGHYKYIRNFYPNRPYLQPCRYKDHKPFMPVLRELYAENKLNAVQSLQMAEVRPEEELYDLSQDPWEINNLAKNKGQESRLIKMRGLLSTWILETDDKGRFPEPESMYDSDMNFVISKGKKRDPVGVEELNANISLMKKWKSEGR